MATYRTGRGFNANSQSFFLDESGNFQRGNVHGSLGFKDFWKNRPELGAGNPMNYDWMTLNRPGIQPGRGPMNMRMPSPGRFTNRMSAAATPGVTPKQYQRWNKTVGQNMTWTGAVRDPATGQAMMRENEAGKVMPVAGASYGLQARDQKAAESSTRIARRPAQTEGPPDTAAAPAFGANPNAVYGLQPPGAPLLKPRGAGAKPKGTQLPPTGLVRGMKYGPQP